MDNSRYDRQQRFAPVGPEGQRKLLASRVGIVGMGALGSVVAELLCRSGVGMLRLIDRDTVELSNLQRQALYDEADALAGLAKVDAAAQHLRAINHTTELDPRAVDLTSHSITDTLRELDLVIDGTDNFETRFLINDFALEAGLPWVHGGCVGASGQVFTFWPGRTICFRCLVPELPAAGTAATCDTAGVLAPATHLVASLQSAEAIRAIVLGPTAARPYLQSFDAWQGRWMQLEVEPLASDRCPACVEGRREYLRGEQAAAEPVRLCGRNAVQIPAGGGPPADLERLGRRWQGLGEVSQNRFLVRLCPSDSLDVLGSEAPTHRARASITVFRDGRTVVEGTEDIAVAKTLHARFVGR